MLAGSAGQPKKEGKPGAAIFKPGYFVHQKIQFQVNVSLVESGGRLLEKLLHIPAVYSPAPPGKVGESFLLFKSKGVGKVTRVHQSAPPFVVGVC